MKKFFIIMASVLMAISSDAQVVTSRTTYKAKNSTLWYGRIGMSINNAAGGNDIVDAMKDEYTDASASSKVGMALDFGFQRNIGRSGLYWGMELGIGSRGASIKEKYRDEEESGENKGHFSSWNVKYSPFTFGYKYSLTDDIKLDGHLGAFFSYDFSGKTKYTWGDGEDEKQSISYLKDNFDFNCFDAGMQVGIGVWWKKFNLDFTYQRGFVPAAKVIVETFDGVRDYDEVECKLYSSNFMIRLGYAF